MRIFEKAFAMRSMAFENPLGFLSILASPDAHKFLSSLMQSVSEYYSELEQGPDYTVEEFTIHKARVGRYSCAIIEMPQPRGRTEAFFVAAVLLADPDQSMFDSKKGGLRYFTLEKGFRLGGPPRTVLCEWTEEGSHVNYGDGPAPRLDLFIEAIEQLLSKSMSVQ
uniref:Uncharacterized protein n=1 Tax=Desulfacinum infernum TaxID=35837 RepID=A0A832A737_9BACT